MQKKLTSKTPRFGEVYMVQFEGDDSEQHGIRPALIFQNNIGNIYSPNVMVLPLTSVKKKTSQPTHVILPAKGTGLQRDSMVLCENPCCISKNKLGKYVTSIPDQYMSRVAEASLLASSAICFLDPKVLSAIWQKAAKLNAAVPA